MGAITNLPSVILPHRLLVVVNIENMNSNKKKGALNPADLELIERVIYRNGDDIAVSIGRSFERLEERIDATEARIYSRFTDIADEIGTELKALRLIVEGDSEVAIGEK
jgi:hypothetical protein